MLHMQWLLGLKIVELHTVKQTNDVCDVNRRNMRNALRRGSKPVSERPQLTSLQL